jgi:hypothetical protein
MGQERFGASQLNPSDATRLAADLCAYRARLTEQRVSILSGKVKTVDRTRSASISRPDFNSNWQRGRWGVATGDRCTASTLTVASIAVWAV